MSFSDQLRPIVLWNDLSMFASQSCFHSSLLPHLVDLGSHPPSLPFRPAVPPSGSWVAGPTAMVAVFRDRCAIETLEPSLSGCVVRGGGFSLLIHTGPSRQTDKVTAGRIPHALYRLFFLQLWKISVVRKLLSGKLTTE